MFSFILSHEGSHHQEMQEKSEGTGRNRQPLDYLEYCPPMLAERILLT